MQRQAVDVTWTHYPKVAVVQRRHVPNSKTFGYRDDGGVYCPQREVGVGGDKFRHSGKILQCQRFQAKFFIGD
ncbi:hypothetical protein Sme01_10450 [Sphaerisporangium melleum]|uniref:Uncharacterized protein n=1 Tax=Sphaerisporangium melleum TaxID=321316 RepID=A0A917VE30_9ACTN|nr:hypothetical protein GCM10007964_07170 [Sphaerisporangium melleum]GII68569.1 hypothetical protein Sme01_10450 [Sphaerisporangium melleum]